MNTLSLPVHTAGRLMADAVLRGALAGLLGMGWVMSAGAAPPGSPSEAVSAAPLYRCPGPLFTNDIHPVQARAQGCTLAQQGRWSQAQAPALPQLATGPSPHALPPAALATGAVANAPQAPSSAPVSPSSGALGASAGSGSSGVSGSPGAFDGLPVQALGAMPVAAPELSKLPQASAVAASAQSSALRPITAPITAPMAAPNPQTVPAEPGVGAQRQRDRHAREIVLAELASTQARIQSLSARPQISAEDDNALQRLRRDEDALRRELARRPG